MMGVRIALALVALLLLVAASAHDVPAYLSQVPHADSRADIPVSALVCVVEGGQPSVPAWEECHDAATALKPRRFPPPV